MSQHDELLEKVFDLFDNNKNIPLTPDAYTITVLRESMNTPHPKSSSQAAHYGAGLGPITVWC